MLSENLEKVLCFCQLLRCHAGVIQAQMQMYIECAPQVNATPGLAPKAAKDISHTPAASLPTPDTVSAPQALVPAAAQQQWLSAKATLSQQHLKQEQSAVPASQGSHHSAAQSGMAKPWVAASAPLQPNLFIPTASTSQRGLDHRIRSDRRSAERGAAPKPPPKFVPHVTESHRPKPDSPDRPADSSHMHELVETDMF